MMSAWGEIGQRPKKKMVAYGKTASKPRARNATVSATSADTDAAVVHAPVKDIYDYDFVDEDNVAPAPKTVTKLKTPHVAKTAARATPPKPASTLASQIAKSTSAGSRSAVRGAAEPARGLKRKPSQIGLGAGDLASNDPSRASNSSQGGKSQRSSSPDPYAMSFPPQTKNANPPGKLNMPSASSSRQRTPKTPPRDIATPKALATARASSTSPSKARPFASTAVPTIRKQTSQPSSLMPFRTDNQTAKPPSQSQQSQPRPMTQGLPRPPQQALRQPEQRKRRRLIDALAAQREEESSDEEEHAAKAADPEDDDSSQTDTILSRNRHARSTPGASEARSPFRDMDSLATASPSKVSLAPSTPATLTRRSTARRPNIKFTYNLERTMLAEEPVLLGGPSGPSDLSLLESLLPEPEPAANAFDFDDDLGGASQGAIQSIHELRQAGANSRFADELVDILDRIGAPSTGKPSSARRSALMEMAQKLQDKSFARHFRDQSGETRLFRDVGSEADIVSGFVLSCIVITLLAHGSASHRLLRELRQEKISSLFATLLASDVDMVVLARDRKTNVSNYGRQTLRSLKTVVQSLPVWKPAPEAPSDVSPRTVALKALRLLAEQLDDDDGVLSASLTKQLFGIVSSGLASTHDDVEDSTPSPPLLLSGLSKNAESVDLHLALSLLEMHSVSAMQSDIGAEWTRCYIPIIASGLGASLQQHQNRSHRLNDLELLVLKLALNTANNNPEAARYYVDKGLLRQLAELSCGALAAMVRSIETEEDFVAEALDELLLMLGVMINFSENDVSAGETLVEESGSVLFDRLGKAFLDGRSSTADADSEEKSQLNVAFAYLSILLGYLCLHDPVYQAFKKLSPSHSLKPVLDSIHQFILFHEQLGKASSAENSAEVGHFTARLRALAQELEVRA